MSLGEEIAPGLLAWTRSYAEWKEGLQRRSRD
jgi:hypothetical protein